MNLLTIGRRRLRIDVRVDHVSHAEGVQTAFEVRKLREEATAVREHWQHEMIATIGMIR